MALGFIVTGMPRSSMPWVSVLLTTDRSVCYPEPIKDMQESEDIDRLMEAKGYSHVGIADTALAFFPDVVDRLLCPVVLIMREPIECVTDLVKMGTDRDAALTYVERMESACKRIQNKMNVLTVQAKQIRDRRVAQKVFWHCLPGIAFDEVRFMLLSQLLIEQNPLAVVASVKNNLSGMQQIFKDRYEHLSETMQ
jgi:hypothetical protein